MITYIFDGTKNGLFSCIFESFYAREIPDDVSNEACQTGLFDINKTIMTDKEKAERVCASLRKCRTVNILSDVAYAFRSGEKNRFFYEYHWKNARESSMIDGGMQQKAKQISRAGKSIPHKRRKFPFYEQRKEIHMEQSKRKELQLTAAKARLLGVQMVHDAASGHPGGSMSCMDVLTYLYFAEMHVDPKNPPVP